MPTEWACGFHVDSDPPFAEMVRNARCLGGRVGTCTKPIVMVFVGLNEADESQPVPPLCMTGSCAKHRDWIRQVAKSHPLSRLGFSEIPIGQVPDLIDWFHGRSGLCLGDRALALLSPGPPPVALPD
jgi:hypothetical protein